MSSKERLRKKYREYESLFICRSCGKDIRKTGRNAEIIRLGGDTEVLCWDCRMQLEDDSDK